VDSGHYQVTNNYNISWNNQESGLRLGI
jgi:hypothetical protein